MLKKILRLIKKIFILVFILALLLAIAVGIFVLNFDLNHYKGLAEQKLTFLLQRPVTIESMHTKLATVPTITINGFTIANNDPFQDKSPLLSIKKMDAVLELLPLLDSQINIHKVEIDAAELNLHQTDAENNWTIHLSETKSSTDTKAPEATTKSAQANNLRLDSVTINSLNVTFSTPKKQQNFVAQNLHLKNFNALDGEIVYNNQTFNFTLNAGTIWDLLAKKQNFPLDIKVKSKLGTVNLNGKIGNFDTLSDLQGTLSAHTNDLKSLCNFFALQNSLIPSKRADLQVQAVGNINKIDIKKLNFQLDSKDFTLNAQGSCVEPLKNFVLNLDTQMQLASDDLAELWKIQPMTLSGDFVISANALKTKKTLIDANRSDLSLTSDIKKNNNNYNITLAAKSSYLNPDDFIRQSAQATENKPAKTSKNASDVSIPWEILKTTTATTDFKIEHLQVGNWITGHMGIDTQPSIKNGKIQAPFKINLLGGQLSGELSGQAAQEKLTLVAKASNLNLNGVRALQEEIQNVILSGQANMDSKGKTVSALLKNLNGKIILQANKGQIINKWLASLPKALNLAKKKQTVAFSSTDNQLNLTCAAANLNIRNGVITGQDQFALETNALDILAGGTINLNQKTMDVVLQPNLADQDKANEILSFSKFIRISGPFNKLTPKVDTAQSSTALLQAGLNKLTNTETKQTVSDVSICQQVLGTAQTKTQTTSQKQPATAPKQGTKKTSAKPVSNKQKFQEQLVNTLFETLTAQ